MEAFVKAHRVAIIIGLLGALVAVLVWLSVEVTMVYSAVAPLLNSGVGRALAST